MLTRVPTKRDAIIGTALGVALGLLTALFLGVGFTIGFWASPAKGAERCAVIGDSIAVGVGQVLKECRTNAKGGIPSKDVIWRAQADVLNIISAGSNDALNPQLGANLIAIRYRVKSAIWILPVHPRAANLIRQIAGPNDGFVPFVPARDNVHPRSYQALARDIRKAMQ